MAYYTMTLKEVIEGLINSKTPIGFNDLNEASRAVIYNDSQYYPGSQPLFPFISTVDKRDTIQGILADLFIKRYLTRELCYDTYGRWAIALEEEWKEAWDKWQLNFKADEYLKSIDPLVGYTKHTDGKSNSHSQGSNTGTYSGTSNSTNRNAFSDTPQGQLNGVEDGDYLTDYRKITDESKDSNATAGTNEDTSSSAFETNEYGTSTSLAKLLEEYRNQSHSDIENFLDEFEDLFFALY